jgi:hypothetical protein
MSLTKTSYSMIQGAVVNVLDFGADPTGVADSTAAIQAAINSLAPTSSAVTPANAGGGTVYIPAGKFRITDTLLIGYGITLMGDGAGGYPYLANNAQMSQIQVDFGASVNKWAIDSATYVTATGLRVAYNAYVNANIDTDYNGLQLVAIRGITLFQLGGQTNIPYGGIRLVGCPNAVIDEVTIQGFGVGIQLNTCFGTSITRVTSQSNYYGLLCYNANNNIYVQGQFDKIVDPSDLTVPIANVPTWMPSNASFVADYYMANTHNRASKGIIIAADSAIGSNSATINVITQFWNDPAFFFSSYANTIVSLYVEGTQAQNIISSMLASWNCINMQNFTLAATKVVDMGVQSIGQINIGGNNLSSTFIQNLWTSASAGDPSYLLLQNSSNTTGPFDVPDHPRLRRLVGQNRGTVTMDVTSATGTITSVTNKESYYIKYGNQVTIYFTFTVADNGTGATYITVTGMPFPCSSTIGASGTAHNSTLGLCEVWVVPTFSTFNIRLYNGTYPAVTGDVIYGSFTYYTASTI